MSTNNIIMAVAGFMIMLTLALGTVGSPIFHHTNWTWVTVFVGFNLFQSAFTGFCPLAIVLKKLGIGK